MPKEYNVGDRLYLPVWITDKETNVMMGPDKSTTITDVKFSYAYWHGKTGEGKVRYGEEGLLLTATEIAENVLGRRCGECAPIHEELRTSNAELKSRNAELEALLKEVTATSDEAIRQNNELMAASDKLKDTLVDRTKDVQHLTEENEKLQNKVGEFQNRVGEQLAEIQDLNAEIHFLKESGKQKPEEEATRTVHVVLNDGTGYNFFKCTKASFDNYGNFTVLKIYRGEEYVAGFLRGDKPTNFAYWWTE